MFLFCHFIFFSFCFGVGLVFFVFFLVFWCGREIDKSLDKTYGASHLGLSELLVEKLRGRGKNISFSLHFLSFFSPSPRSLERQKKNQS